LIYNLNMQAKSLIIGVMRGGPSPEYDVSLKTGSNVMNELRASDRYTVRDIFIDRNGIWHIDGMERSPERVLPHVNLIFNALHGTYGEDGRVQQILASHSVPFTGSHILPSALGMNKWLSKKYFREAGIKTPRAIVVRSGAHDLELDNHTLASILDDFHGAAVVKPLSSGSSLGVTVVREPSGFAQAIKDALAHSPQALIEEYIFGREAAVAVLDGSEDGVTHSLPPIAIKNKSTNKGFFNFDAKFSEDLREIVCPGDFSAEERWALEDAGLKAHRALGLRHYSRSDFIVTPNGVYILETNSLPGLTQTSLLPHALAAAGVTFGEFLDHVVGLVVK